MKIKYEDGNIIIDSIDIFEEMKDEERVKFLELFTFQEIVESIENQLKHKTEMWSSCTDGHQDGQKIREYILNIQGIEPEHKKDMGAKIRSLEHKVEHYKKYYDWYFKAYHCENLDYGKSMFQRLREIVGEPSN